MLACSGRSAFGGGVHLDDEELSMRPPVFRELVISSSRAVVASARAERGCDRTVPLQLKKRTARVSRPEGCQATCPPSRVARPRGWCRGRIPRG